MEEILRKLWEIGYRGGIGLSSSGEYFSLAGNGNGPVIRVRKLNGNNGISYFEVSLEKAIEEYGSKIEGAFERSKGKLYGVPEYILKKLNGKE